MSLLEKVMVGSVAAGTAAVALFYLWRSAQGSGGVSPRPAATSVIYIYPPGKNTTTTLAGKNTTTVKTVTTAAKGVSTATALANLALNTIAPVVAQAAAQVATTTANVVTATTNKAATAVQTVTGAVSQALTAAGQAVGGTTPLATLATATDSVGDIGATSIQAAGDLVSGSLNAGASGLTSGLGGVGTVAGAFAVKTLVDGGIAGKSQAQQAQTFGQAGVQTAQLFLSTALPGLGSAISSALGFLASTGTGAKVVNAVVGKPVEQVYTIQKDLLDGDIRGVEAVFGGGGSTHADRVSGLVANEKARLAQLATGGTLTAADIATFQELAADGGGDQLNTTPGFEFSSWVQNLKVGESLVGTLGSFGFGTSNAKSQAAQTASEATALAAAKKAGTTLISGGGGTFLTAAQVQADQSPVAGLTVAQARAASAARDAVTTISPEQQAANDALLASINAAAAANPNGRTTAVNFGATTTSGPSTTSANTSTAAPGTQAAVNTLLAQQAATAAKAGTPAAIAQAATLYRTLRASDPQAANYLLSLLPTATQNAVKTGSALVVVASAPDPSEGSVHGSGLSF